MHDLDEASFIPDCDIFGLEHDAPEPIARLSRKHTP
jgi:hypothetical protein